MVPLHSARLRGYVHGVPVTARDDCRDVPIHSYGRCAYLPLSHKTCPAVLLQTPELNVAQVTAQLVNYLLDNLTRPYLLPAKTEKYNLDSLSLIGTVMNIAVLLGDSPVRSLSHPEKVCCGFFFFFLPFFQCTKVICRHRVSHLCAGVC